MNTEDQATKRPFQVLLAYDGSMHAATQTSTQARIRTIVTRMTDREKGRSGVRSLRGTTQPMSLIRGTVEDYTALLARAFQGAITVNGDRIVAHPSGTLFVRGDPRAFEERTRAWQRLNALGPGALDKDNDWSEV